jgi:hypothetical protein
LRVWTDPTRPVRPCEHGPITQDETQDENETAPDVEDARSDDPPGSGFERWRRESALGAVGTGIAKGLRNVFAPTDDHQVIVAEVPGDPPDAGERLRVILDPDDPTKSVAIVPEHASDASPEASDPPSGATPQDPPPHPSD